MAEYNTYPNMKILHNTPDQVIEYCTALWEESKDVIISKSDLGSYSYYSEDEIIQYVEFKSDILNSMITRIFNINVWGTMWVTSYPNVGMDHMHIDSTRCVGINIPISVDFDNSCFFIANQKCTERPSEVRQRRFEYEPERYDWYNIKKPTIINAAVPHGYFNHANERRVLLSISVEGTYEEVLAKLPKNLYS
jgi:hypothetical protein